MATRSRFIITAISILIFMLFFVIVKDIVNKSQYKYYIYQNNNYIGKCKQIEKSKYMSLILIKDFVNVDGKTYKKGYMSEKYKIIED